MNRLHTSLVAASILALSLASPSIARAEVHEPVQARIGVAGGAALLGSDTGAGLAFDLGARVELDSTHALSFRIGYGVLVGERETQDRWWILATYGGHLALAPGLRLELGGGLGAGAVSGYDHLDAFIAAPFDPTWAYQLLPAATVHTRLWWEAGNVSFFVGAEFGALMDVPGLGVREGSARQAGDLMWFTVSVGTALWP